MWSLVEHGRAGDDPAFYFAEFAAPAGCEVDDQDAWTVANPALDDFLHRDALRATLRTSRESSFRRFRLGQWVEQVEGAWLPDGAWASCAVDGFEIPDGTKVVLGLDGSFSQDCTALVAVTVEDNPHVAVVALWESTGDGYRVPTSSSRSGRRAAGAQALDPTDRPRGGDGDGTRESMRTRRDRRPPAIDLVDQQRREQDHHGEECGALLIPRPVTSVV